MRTQKTKSLAVPGSIKEVGLCTWTRIQMRRLVRWPMFDYIMGLFILCNSVFIGLEVSTGIIDADLSFIDKVEHAFLAVYLGELILRFGADGLACCRMPWVHFDMLLVFIGITNMWVIRPLNEKSIESLQPLMILRIFRLLRLLRALRLISHFKTMWRLVQGLMNSGGTMFSTLMLIILVLYVFACFGIELITKDESLRKADPLIEELIESSFADIPSVMLTLVQFVTLDSVAGVYVPLIRQRWWLVFYFAPILIVISIALMNLVTASLVEAAMSLSTIDMEMERTYMRQRIRRLIPGVRDAFHLIDADRNGHINKAEVENCVGGLPPALMEVVRTDNLMEVFEMLDGDNSGRIDEEEFVDGVLHLALSDVPLETTQMLKILRHLRKKMDGMEVNLGKIGRRLRARSTTEPKRATTVCLGKVAQESGAASSADGEGSRPRRRSKSKEKVRREPGPPGEAQERL